MSKPESTYSASINKLLPVELHREKMHNVFRGGTADFWYSGTLDDLWVEYKYLPKIPLRTPIRVYKLLSALQLIWLNGPYREGRNVVVILGTPQKSWIYADGAWQVRDVSKSILLDSGHDRKAVAAYIWGRTML